ncbi:hypothetical protein [Bradyrhizobium sp.]|uniref:hypothetical protein n=1 Tax=Bradyrhizobium sp. TaxID=376 RepID=UPI0039E3DC4D
MSRQLREFRRLERVCLEQAALSDMDLARSSLLKVADDFRLAAEAIEARSSPRATIADAVQALKQMLNRTRTSNRH